MYLRRKCYADVTGLLNEVKSATTTSTGEEKAKNGIIAWIKENPKKSIGLAALGATAIGGGIYAGVRHRRKKQAEAAAEAAAEEAAQTAYSDTYDYCMRLFSDELEEEEEDPNKAYTEDDLKAGKIRSYFAGPLGSVAAGRGIKAMKDSLRNGDDIATARIKGEKKAAKIGAIEGALAGAGLGLAGSHFLMKSSPALAAGIALAGAGAGAGLMAGNADLKVRARAEAIRKRSRDRRDK